MVTEPSAKRVKIALRAQDIQTGLQEYQIGEFETLTKTGIATRLAIHLRGGDLADYQRLKDVSFALFGVDKLSFPSIMELLEDVEFVRVVGTGRNRKIVPTVPYFDDLYETLGEKAEQDGLNEIEQASVAVLDRLAASPIRKDLLAKSLGIQPKVLDTVAKIGHAGSYVEEIGRTAEPILISPVYFSENSAAFAAVVAKFGEPAFRQVFQLLQQNPGWPVAKILTEGAIGGTKLTTDECNVISALMQNGLLQPPAITTAASGTNHFLFTPPLGNTRIQVVEKEIYEKAMAVLSCVRQGEHFAKWNIRSPHLVINALLRDGWLRSNTEAREQYRALVIKKIAKLEPPGAAWQKVVLIDSPENRRALAWAVEMLKGSEVLDNRGLVQNARDLIFTDKDYAEHLRGFGMLRARKVIPRAPDEYQSETEKLIEAIQKGG